MIDRKLAFALMVGAASVAMSISNGASALSQRTFVKSTGVDNPVCSLIAPCRSFAAALLQTQDKGEIIVLDSAGYGTVMIHQSVSIIAPRGVHAGISVDSTNQTGVSATGNNLRVVLEGLSIIQAGGGLQGIFLNGNGSSFYVNRCTISGGMNDGLTLFSTTGAKLFVNGLEIRDNGLHAIFLNAVGAHAVLNHLTLENNAQGLVVGAVATVSVRDSVIARNLTHGITISTGLTVNLTVEDSLLTENGGSGVWVNGAAGAATADLRHTSMIANQHYGAQADTTNAASQSTMTIAGSQLALNSFGGVGATGAGTTLALVNGNAISHNGGHGLETVGTGVIHTRSNNVGDQPSPTFGTITPVAGF